MKKQSPSPTFSLKDLLFNTTKVTKIANELQHVYPAFKTGQFIQSVTQEFPQLELKQRITWISQQLAEFLPKSYPDAISIILKSLPAPCNPALSDDDFGDFIYAPYGLFVATHGCTPENLSISLNTIKELTTRFSMEDAIRYFINAFPDQTMAALMEWAKDSHYHVRRLASEGTRPKLPWCQKIMIDPQHALPILELLASDPTRFVTRSVANHLNDISKIHPEWVLTKLQKWKSAQRQTDKEMAFIINHSLRTLIKKGHPDTLTFLNFSTRPAVTLCELKIHNQDISFGEAVSFEFTLEGNSDEPLLIDYIIHFQNHSGVANRKKVYKLKKVDIKKGQQITITKIHKLRANMTTIVLYPGIHQIDIQINGNQMASETFEIL